jgi:hypothetical protein
MAYSHDEAGTRIFCFYIGVLFLSLLSGVVFLVCVARLLSLVGGGE